MTNLGMLRESKAKYDGSIANVANGWNTTKPRNMSTFHETQRIMGEATGAQSILVGGIENKFDIAKMTQGEAVGGPDKKPKISMWDLLTLYDSKKKRVED